MYRFDALVFLANAGRMRDEIMAAIDEVDAAVSCVVLDAASIYDVVSSGAQMLLAMIDALAEQDTRLVLARVRSEFRDELTAAGIEARLGTELIYLDVDDAGAANKPPKG